jgi:hypothetical protein
MTPIHTPVLPDPEGQVRSTSAESEAPVAARHPIIYNLFPTLAGQAPRWVAHAERARRMGFGWIYLNSVRRVGVRRCGRRGRDPDGGSLCAHPQGPRGLRRDDMTCRPDTSRRCAAGPVD